jgi:peptidyl-prolyl cis-trans isomerase C
MVSLPKALLLCLAPLALASCGEPPAPPSPGAATTAPAVQSEGLARIAGQPVTEADFDAYLRLKRIPAQDPNKRERALDDYLERESMARAILAQGLLDEADTAAELAEFRRQMLLSRYFEQYLERQVSDQSVGNYYAANRERYSAHQARVAHILIRTNAKMSQAEREALLTKAQEVYSRAMAKEDFAALAGEYSEDLRSAKRGGEIGWVAEGAVDPAFSAAVFALHEGDLSQPVATPFGFHVIKLLEGPQVQVQPFEKVKGDIRYELREQSRQAETERLKGLMHIERDAGTPHEGG